MEPQWQQRCSHMRSAHGERVAGCHSHTQATTSAQPFQGGAAPKAVHKQRIMTTACASTALTDCYSRCTGCWVWCATRCHTQDEFQEDQRGMSRDRLDSLQQMASRATPQGSPFRTLAALTPQRLLTRLAATQLYTIKGRYNRRQLATSGGP